MLAWRDVINQRVKPLSHLQFVALQSTPILVVGLGSLFCHLLLQVGTPTEEDVVDKGVLQQGQKDKHKAAHEENVNGLDVGDLGKSLSKVVLWLRGRTGPLVVQSTTLVQTELS